MQQQQQLQAAGAAQRELSTDDFPALGTPNDLAGQAPGLQNCLLNGQATAAAATRANQEQQQASAAAALAHRQNLLGTMTGAQQSQHRSVANAAASTTTGTPQQAGQGQGFGDEQTAKRNYANKLAVQQSSQQPGAAHSSSLSPYPASGSLPPPTSQVNGGNNGGSTIAPPSQRQQQSGLSPGHQASGAALNGIGQALDGSSPSIAGRPLPPSSGAQGAGGLPAQLSNLLLQQHLATQGSHQHHQLPAHLAAHHPQQPPIPQTPAQQVLYSPADRFGLLGLLNIIKVSADPDFGMLTLGTDLEKLGLDLGSTENIHSNFITPWADLDAVSALNIEPEYQLPPCYNVQPPPASSKVQHFSDETLFFVFYSQPRDAMQEAAAEQLYKRNWRYHKDLHLWLTKDVGTEPTQKTATYERGSYIFFDPNTWEKVQKEFVLVFEHLETRHRGTGAAIQQQQQQNPQQQQAQTQASYAGLPGLAQ